MIKNSDKIKVFKCEATNCGFITIYSNILHSHIQSHDLKHDYCKSLDTNIDFRSMTYTEKEFPCPFNCEFTSNDRNELLKHIESHSTLLQYGGIECPFDNCNYIIKSLSFMKFHIKVHYSDLYYSCYDKNCGYKSISRCSMYYHICCIHPYNTAYQSPSISTSDLLFCSVFNCTFKTHSSKIMTKHSKYHSMSDRKLFKCSEKTCSYITDNKYRMYVHKVKKHEKNRIPIRKRRNFSIQPDILPRKNVLYRSSPYIEPPNSIYKCEYCNYSSYSNIVLLRHLTIHEKFKCWHKNCYFSCLLEEIFRRHLYQVHHILLPTQTTKSRATIGILKQPIVYNPYSENEFKKNVKRNYNKLLKHKKSNYKCDKNSCFYETSSKILYRRHIKAHNSKIYYKCKEPQCYFISQYYFQYYYHYQHYHSKKVPQIIKSINSKVNSNDININKKSYYCNKQACKYKTSNKYNYIHHNLYYHQKVLIKCSYPRCHFTTRYPTIIKYHFKRKH